MFDAAGKPASLCGRANGAVIEFVVDHSDGSLAIGVNGAPPQRVPKVWPPGYNPWDHHPSNPDPTEGQPPAKVPFKFPQGAQLRPWLRLDYLGDRIRFERAYL